MKKVVLFDIDFTLFNSKRYRDRFTEQIQQLIDYKGDDFGQISEEVYQALRKNLAYFDPQLYSERLSEKLQIPIDGKKIEEIILNEELMEESLYEDTIEVLKFLAKQEGLILGVFSAGLMRAQQLKIKKLENYFHRDHIHIFEFKKHHALSEMLEKYRDDEIVIVDDMIHVLYEAKKIRSDIFTIWIKRPERSTQDSRIDNFEPDSIIRSLREVVPVIV